MNKVAEQYTEFFHKVKALQDQISGDGAAIDKISQGSEGDIPARIDKLEEQLEKIDEYLLKIQAFRKLAEGSLSSKNILTVEAPPGYRVNLNRLRQWAMMIDPQSKDDPYAQRVYIVANCDEYFLNGKKTEFRERIAQLRQEMTTGAASRIRQLQADIAQCGAELNALFTGPDMAEFAAAVTEANQAYWYEEAPQAYANAAETVPAIAPGAYALPLEAPEELRQTIKGMFGRFYDADGGRVLLPMELDTSAEFAVFVDCAAPRLRQLYRGLQNLILSIAEKYPAGKNRVYVLDALRFNTASLGSLRQIEDTFALSPVPRNPEQLSETLENIVSSFSDMDDILELCDSVIEYNRGAEEQKQLSRTTIILYGWPKSFCDQDREYIQRIMTNYERYGISFVCVSLISGRKDRRDEDATPEFVDQNAIHIRMLSHETTVRSGDDSERRFTWYSFTGELSNEYAASLRENKVEKAALGNEYIKRFNCEDTPQYDSRQYKKIELPFGVDSKDQVHSLSFENENFAAFLEGASRSGKSTLLHTLIVGLIRNYHPDNVELWLADFKQLEFKKYMVHCPPHVKYILLDQSPELVCDLIDKLTDKMMERQRLLAHLGKERIDQIDPTTLSEPMPVIFVILDEFSIMSQAIADSDIYKLRLQNILAKGAALGIKFLFSSQTFTSGVGGLTPTARAQVQQRIAMKGSKEEIIETMELSPNLRTEQVQNWMDALPPHYALVKYRQGADTLPQVMRMLVLYFPDYSVRDNMIENLNRAMKPGDVYCPTDNTAYVDKHPVVVDGNTYEAFSPKTFVSDLRAAKKEQGELYGENYFALGTPRLMTRVKMIVLTRETRENMLLVGRAAEKMCIASIITTVMRESILQGKKVQVWAYGRNPLYKFCREGPWKDGAFADVGYTEDMDAVCDAMYKAKKEMREKKTENRLIVLIGIDRICSDFEFVDGGTGVVEAANAAAEESIRQREAELKESGAIADNDADMDAIRNAQMSMQETSIRERAAAENRDEAWIKAACDEARHRIFPEKSQEQKESAPAEAAAEQDKAENAAPAKSEHKSGAYNAIEDFRYIIKQGSRFGCHFMFVLNSLADLKASGMKLEWFQHRMAFQVTRDDSYELFNSRVGESLPEHICEYSDTLERHSFRPYLHPGISWEGWAIDEDGKAINPYETDNA